MPANWRFGTFDGSLAFAGWIWALDPGLPRVTKVPHGGPTVRNRCKPCQVQGDTNRERVSMLG